MTLEQILDCDADKLEAMTDEQLLAHFSQYFPVTRPEMVTRSQANQKTEPAVVMTPQKQQVMQMLAAEGIDLSFVRRKKR